MKAGGLRAAPFAMCSLPITCRYITKRCYCCLLQICFVCFFFHSPIFAVGIDASSSCRVQLPIPARLYSESGEDYTVGKRGPVAGTLGAVVRELLNSKRARSKLCLKVIILKLHRNEFTIMSSPSNGDAATGNPVLASYERWSASTPFVTRCTMVGIVIAYIFSFFFDAEIALGNIPYYSIMHFEVYRIFLSFLVGNSILSLVMIALFFPSMAGRMENSLGSAGLLVLMGSVCFLTNILFDFICVVVSFMGSAEAVFWSCDNFWVVVFGLITIECMQVNLH